MSSRQRVRAASLQTRVDGGRRAALLCPAHKQDAYRQEEQAAGLGREGNGYVTVLYQCQTELGSNVSSSGPDLSSTPTAHCGRTILP